jgi:EmrB/QacA subfamily drug resistance transporter
MLPVILATTLLMTLNTAIVNVALSGIRADLGFTAASLSWVINGYLLTYGGLLIVGGRLGDIIGRRRTMLIGLATFTLASCLAGFAWSPASLVVARAVQGFGGALAAPSVLAIITQQYQGHARSRALGWFSVVLGAGLSLGMILGGVLLQWLEWRWIFWLNVPIGLILFALTLFVVPVMRADERPRLDLLGAALVTATAVSVVLGFVELANVRELDLAVVVSFVVAVLALVGLFIRLRVAREPLVPLELFSSLSVPGALVANALQAGAMTGMIFFVSQLFTNDLGLAPVWAGALFLVFTAPQLLSALSANRLIRTHGVRRVVLAGLFISIVGMTLLSVATRSSELSLWLIVAMFVTGAGAGVVYLGVNITVMSAVLPHFAGAASGVVQSSVQLGASIGVAVLVLIQSISDTTGALLAAAVLLFFALCSMSLRDRPVLPDTGHMLTTADSTN